MAEMFLNVAWALVPGATVEIAYVTENELAIGGTEDKLTQFFTAKLGRCIGGDDTIDSALWKLDCMICELRATGRLVRADDLYTEGMHIL